MYKNAGEDDKAVTLSLPHDDVLMQVQGPAQICTMLAAIAIESKSTMYLHY